MVASVRTVMKHLHEELAYEPRIHTLVDRIQPELRPGDRVLDVGCGGGALGAALAGTTPDLTVEGVEIRPRGSEPISVHPYAGDTLPFANSSYDVVILADVLHHERKPVELLQECQRVSRRLVVIKDHLKDGALSEWRIRLLDWAANHPYGVECLYTYWTKSEWQQMLEHAGLSLEDFVNPLSLYHPAVDWAFGGAIQFVAFCTPRRTS